MLRRRPVLTLYGEMGTSLVRAIFERLRSIHLTLSFSGSACPFCLFMQSLYKFLNLRILLRARSTIILHLGKKKLKKGGGGGALGFCVKNVRQKKKGGGWGGGGGGRLHLCYITLLHFCWGKNCCLI